MKYIEIKKSVLKKLR